ncbi:MAG: hypothetical protein LBL87_06895 [Ruminococcus sp.]|jgi:hypothetical protein|nr:hypothetical protein [Ruminococcus sp.]
MKKVISLILSAIMVLSVCSVSVLAAPALSKTSIELAKGYQTTLKVTGTSGSVAWSSSNTAVATVSGGKVVGKSVGTAKIYAKVSGVTLTCDVNIVATKITLSKYADTIGIGETITVTATVLGDKTGISMSNGNSAVARGKFISPARFSGNTIKFNITAYRAGTASITIYRKNYRDTYFKAITVKVTDGDVGYNDDASVKAVDGNVVMDEGGKTSVTVWTTDVSELQAYALDPSVIRIKRTGVNGNYVTYSVEALKAGKTVIKAYINDEPSRYCEIPVTVNPKAEYYKIYESVAPSKLKDTDVLLNFTNNSKTYYILAPYDYDSANTNSIIGGFTKKYDYYTVYDKVPTVKASGDTIKNFTDDRNYMYRTLYVLVPISPDNVAFDTAKATYLDSYEYYTIYNVSPKKQTNTDFISSWTVKSLKTNNTITRYMLLPILYDEERASTIRDNDQMANNGYAYYVVYTEFPNNLRTGDRLFTWYKNNDSTKVRYVAAPSKEEDFLRRNEVIYRENGYLTYFTAYSSSVPMGVADSTKESIQRRSIQINGVLKDAYVLVDQTDPSWKTKLENAFSGSFYTTKDGNYYGDKVYD